MQPIDFRNATLADLQGRVTGLRQEIWLAYIRHGPATTRQMARTTGIDILTLRPRVTELYQLGALRIWEPTSGTEGVYKARTLVEWEQWIAEHRQQLTSAQLQMDLPKPSCHMCGSFNLGGNEGGLCCHDCGCNDADE